jgi:hypothetical protein
MLQEHLYKRFDAPSCSQGRPVVRQRKNHFERRLVLAVFRRLNDQTVIFTFAELVNFYGPINPVL